MLLEDAALKQAGERMADGVTRGYVDEKRIAGAGHFAEAPRGRPLGLESGMNAQG